MNTDYPHCNLCQTTDPTLFEHPDAIMCISCTKLAVPASYNGVF